MLVFASVAAGFAHEPYKMAIWMNGQKVGFGTIHYGLDKKGHMVKHSETTVFVGDLKQEAVNESTFDLRGRPVETSEVDTLGGQRSRISIAFGKKDLTISLTMGGTTKVIRKDPLPKGDIQDRAALWFVAIRPKIGERTTCLDYDFSTAKWKPKTLTYAGFEPVPGLKVSGHHIVGKDTDEWRDDHGNPIRMEQRMPAAVTMLIVRE